jgi:GNAT superfamily N-acetyltransferase
MALTPEIEFRQAAFDTGAGAALLQAMRDEMREVYDGLDMDSDDMPRAGAAELGPPSGALLVGWSDGEPVCVGGVKRLDERACEIKRMYVAPSVRGRGVARPCCTSWRRRRAGSATSSRGWTPGPASRAPAGCTSQTATPRLPTSTPIRSRPSGARSRCAERRLGHG